MSGPLTQLLSLEEVSRIGKWNVRTKCDVGKTTEVVTEM